jgi:tRNA A-37 threonylcarbamoyl transferase component Bud32
MDDLIGKTLGIYRILERLGRGGMATVYKAYQPALERHVAIKVIHPHLASDEEQFLKRFQREAKAVASLRHPHIVRVFDFGTEDDVSYMVMEYLEGITLKAKLDGQAQRGETMPLEAVLHTFRAVAGALEYAHGQGMIHRDVKPANVILTTDGDVVLTDFGIARMVGGTQFTATGAVIGTPAYMSPEQGHGERGDARSDVYALGVMLFEMVTGRVPFDADTPLAVILKHISAPLPLPRQVNPQIPEAVERVILKALAKDPNDRYQTVAEMAGALETAVTGEAIAGREEPSVAAIHRRGMPWAAVGLGLAGAGALVLALAIIVVGGIAFPGRRPTPLPLAAPPTLAPPLRATRVMTVPLRATPPALPIDGRSPDALVYVSSGRRSDDVYVWAGGTACCGCRVRNYGQLPPNFPEADVNAVTFYLATSREDSYYTQVKAGPTGLKLILGDRESLAATRKVAGAARLPVQVPWLVTFKFDPPVRARPGTQWQLLDGDGDIYSGVWPHCSDLDREGLPGVQEITDCQYADAVDVWYSTKFDFGP